MSNTTTRVTAGQRRAAGHPQSRQSEPHERLLEGHVQIPTAAPPSVLFSELDHYKIALFTRLPFLVIIVDPLLSLCGSCATQKAQTRSSTAQHVPDAVVQRSCTSTPCLFEVRLVQSTYLVDICTLAMVSLTPANEERGEAANGVSNSQPGIFLSFFFLSHNGNNQTQAKWPKRRIAEVRTEIGLVPFLEVRNFDGDGCRKVEH
ncbi:hypothetical protein B0H65DRAFT_474768 [Neurospora tetraspora]|uniref:Uncharacterized protein n=1 Tax=Neurospora tetraspora TaxID=94610 RepID=A0AAE0J923_9PEZI|nr:hypothetical protein B0H65DRAFT_474768 [Neurospora tetraspora]